MIQFHTEWWQIFRFLICARFARTVLGIEIKKNDREIALGRRDPQIGAPGVKNQSEALRRRSDSDLPKVLHVHVIIQQDYVLIGGRITTRIRSESVYFFFRLRGWIGRSRVFFANHAGRGGGGRGLKGEDREQEEPCSLAQLGFYCPNLLDILSTETPAFSLIFTPAILLCIIKLYKSKQSLRHAPWIGESAKNRG